MRAQILDLHPILSPQRTSLLALDASDVFRGHHLAQEHPGAFEANIAVPSVRVSDVDEL